MSAFFFNFDKKYFFDRSKKKFGNFRKSWKFSKSRKFSMKKVKIFFEKFQLFSYFFGRSQIFFWRSWEKKSEYQYRSKMSLRIEWEHSQPLKITLEIRKYILFWPLGSKITFFSYGRSTHLTFLRFNIFTSVQKIHDIESLCLMIQPTKIIWNNFITMHFGEDIMRINTLKKIAMVGFELENHEYI